MAAMAKCLCSHSRCDATAVDLAPIVTYSGHDRPAQNDGHKICCKVCTVFMRRVFHFLNARECLFRLLIDALQCQVDARPSQRVQDAVRG